MELQAMVGIVAALREGGPARLHDRWASPEFKARYQI
jgi:hypothetical protein